MSNFPLPGSVDKNLGRVLPRKAQVKIYGLHILIHKCIFFSNPNIMNLTFFPNQWDSFERKFNKYTGQRLSIKEFIEKWEDTSLRLILKD